MKKCSVIICCMASPHHAPTKWQVFCRNVHSMNWRVVVHLLAERSQQLLLVKLFSSVLCPYKMTGPLPTHYKMSCFLLLPTHYSPTMPPQSERSSSHIPHHSKSCPYKMRGFLTNTYNRGWHCCSIFLSFSQAYNLRLWSVQNSSGFWHPSMVPSKKKADTHTQNNKVSSWVFDAFWIYYKMGILNLLHPNRVGCFKMLKAPQSQLFVYKLGPR